MSESNRALICFLYGKSDPALDAVRLLAERCDTTWHLDLLPLEDAGGIENAVAAALDGGADRILIGGGDGSIREAASLLAEARSTVPLGIVPLGTGNDLARSLDLRGDLPTVIDTVLGSKATAIDMVEASFGDEHSWFINVANGGFGGLIAEQVEDESKSRWGPFAYWMSTIGSLRDDPRFRVQVQFDEDDPFEITVCALAVANGRYLGGGFPIAQSARIDDGLIDVVLAPPLPSEDFLRAGMNMVFGNGEKTPEILRKRAKKVSVQSVPEMPFSIDGDLREFDEVTFTVHPGAVRLLVGEEPEALSDSATFWDRNDFSTDTLLETEAS